MEAVDNDSKTKPRINKKINNKNDLSPYFEIKSNNLFRIFLFFTYKLFKKFTKLRLGSSINQ